jgi:lipoprotein-anchoring transpeptidase ErfK/SrfK
MSTIRQLSLQVVVVASLSGCVGLSQFSPPRPAPLVSVPDVALAPIIDIRQPSLTPREANAKALRRSTFLAALESAPAIRRRGSPMRLVVSLNQRTLAAVVGRDTIFLAPVGVATGLTLHYAGEKWRFQTPRGSRTVLRKVEHPIWTPPDWHYAEVARENGLKLARLETRGTALSKGRRLLVRNKRVGIIFPGEKMFEPLPTNEHIVFDEKLFVPPIGTVNRRVWGELGDFALDLGDGYMIHGTWDDDSGGQASTHGCIRMRDEDIAWVFKNVPVGTQVTIK